jgi:hypothetical protein
MSDRPELRVNPTTPAGATEALHGAHGQPGQPIVPSNPSPPAARREQHDEPGVRSGRGEEQAGADPATRHDPAGPRVDEHA